MRDHALTTSLWLTAALLSMIAEFSSGTFYLLIISVALAAAGICSLLGGNEALCWIMASVAGSIGLGLLSRWRRKRRPAMPPAADDPDIGQTVRIISLQNAEQARVYYRGTEWQARLQQETHQQGVHATIVGRDGNILIISTHPAEPH